MVFYLILLFIICLFIGSYSGSGNQEYDFTSEVMKYLNNHFKLGLTIKQLFELRKKFKTNHDFLEHLSADYTPKHSNYTAGMKYKIGLLKKMLPEGAQIKTILDIGTESLETLDFLEEVFDGAKVRGINIEDFPHYTKFNREDPRFQIYEKEIPFKGNDLVLIFSVLHHVHDIDEFLDETVKAADKYIIIKENDLVDERTAYFYKIQHLVFEKYFYKNNREAFRRYDTTFKMFEKKLAERGFSLINKIEYNNFTKTGFLVFNRDN